jgi:dTDP-4-amino-4,6-dideoxygalactose transaminase
VGEKIIGWGKPQPLPTYEGFDAYWVDSGTSALALTIIAAKQLRPNIKNPEVILPAYGCPDLVAAAVYAKVQPVLVDVDLNDPGYDLEQLQSAINENTIAVVAVNFLGISDRLIAIKNLLPKNTFLIEDNAQCYAAMSEPANITGDFAITSFGRGKPVSLLGGGLTLIRTSLSKKINLPPLISPPKPPALIKLKIAIYNCLLTPQLYLLVNRCPFITLGETHYHLLNSIHQLDKKRAALLATNITRHTNQVRPAKQCLLSNEKKMLDLTHKLKERTTKLLRHPVLISDKCTRDKLIESSKQLGLGCSPLYQKALINIASIKSLVKLHSSNNAERFAEQLLTLPCNQPPHHKKQLSQLMKSAQKP